MLPCDLRSVREKANRAPLYVPTRDLDYELLFEPLIFDPYYMARDNYLRAAGFYTYESEEEKRAVLDIARHRMENWQNCTANTAGYVPCVHM